MERGAEARLSMESLEAFFTLYWPRLVRFLRTQASNSSLAEDVAGDAFLKAWDRWDMLLRYERPDSWLFKVAIHQLRRVEARARSSDSLAEDLIASTADIQQAAVMDEWVAEHLTLIAAIRALPRRQAEVIACGLVGYTTRETAEILGISAGTVRSNLRYARDKLALLMPAMAEEGEFTEPSADRSAKDKLRNASSEHAHGPARRTSASRGRLRRNQVSVTS
jgi:RNA polymerase sigma-70 factor (ECF subfamily)